MTIGDSKGAFYDDEFHQVASDWIVPEDPNDDKMVVTPSQQRQNKQLEDVEMKELGRIEVSNVIPLRAPANDNKNLDLGIGGLSEADIDHMWNALRDEMRPKPFLVPSPSDTKPK